MQRLTTILIILTALASSLVASNQAVVGSMPAIEVTAPRYAGQDVAWSGLMPAVEVTAPRHENEDIAWAGLLPVVQVLAERVSEILTDETDGPTAEFRQATLVGQGSEPDCELDMQCADLKIFGAIPNAVTFSGDYNLPAGDTIDEDVTVTGGNAVIDGVISGDLAVMGGAVDVNGTITGDVAVFGGNLEMNGYIDGDAAVLGGNIRNKGTIDGDLHVIGGTVYLDSASAVNGDVSMVGGTVERDENAVVLGKIESVEIKVLEKVLPRISKAFRLPRMVPGAEAFPRIVFIGMLVVMFVLNIFVVLLFPRATGNIAEKIQQSVWACVGLGIAFEILFVPIIVLLAVSIVGIPLIILLPLAVLLATLFGMTALSLIVGERVVAGFKWNVESDIGKFCLGWLAIMLIPIVVILIGPPVFVIGAVIFYIATTISLGSVIYTLMRRKKVAEAKK